MERRISKIRIAILGLGIGWLVLPVASAHAQGVLDSKRDNLEGTWGVLVTLTDCATGNPLPVPPFRSLMTFARGGSLFESSGGLFFAPNQRSVGHGRWTHMQGHTYGQHVLALILFDNTPQTVPPLFAGWQTVDHVVTLTGRDSFTSEGTTAFIRASGEVYRQGCSKAVGERFRG